MLVTRIVLLSVGLIAPLFVLPHLKRLFSVRLVFFYPLALFCVVTFFSSMQHPNIVTIIELSTLIASILIAQAIEQTTHDRVGKAVLLAASIILAESLVRLAGRAAGVDWLWLSPPNLGWRVLLLAGDWMDYTQPMLMALPLVFHRARRNRWWCVWLGAFLIALFFSGQRSAWLAALFVLLILPKGKQQWMISTTCIAIFLCLFVLWRDLIFVDRTTHEGGGTLLVAVSSDMSRSAMWKQAKDLWLDYPLLGVGYGNYKIGECATYCAYHAHNQALDILTKTGIVGFTIWGWILYEVGKHIRGKEQLSLILAMGILAIFGQVYWVVWLSLALKKDLAQKMAHICDSV